MESGKDRILYVFNHGQTPAASTVALQGGWRAIDLITDKPFAAVAVEGNTRFDVSVSARDVRVLHLTQ
jgi:hypothetical protein